MQMSKWKLLNAVLDLAPKNKQTNKQTKTKQNKKTKKQKKNIQRSTSKRCIDPVDLEIAQWILRKFC